MKPYKVKYLTNGDHSLLSAEWTGTKREAEKLARGGNGDFSEIDVATNKAGLIAFLGKQT